MDIRYISTAGYDFYCEPCTESGTVCSGIGSGSIELDYDWQMISIPIQYGYWDSTSHAHVHDSVTLAKFENYVLDQITDLYGTGIIEVANTYIGGNGFFWNYVVGSTPAASPHNFQLAYVDNTFVEYTGLWIKVVGVGGPYVITWGE